MTLMDKPVFMQAFNRLAVALRDTNIDAATLQVYFAALSDLDVEFVVMAAERFATGAALNDQGQAWFPKAPEWRVLAQQIEHERQATLRARLRKLPTPACQTCDDTGWRDAGALDGHRVVRCECQDLRRLEVLGRRPMPQLTSGEPG